MNFVPKLFRIFLSSPWFLLVFLVVPALVVLSLQLHLVFPFLGPQLLLANNIAFTALALIRLAWYLLRLPRALRYGTSQARPRGASYCSHSAVEARGILAQAGFSFAPGGDYAEKRDLGYLGTVILYCGLSLLLATGSWDNLCKFSGVILDGVGPATKLSQLASYRNLVKGPFAAKLDSMPQMRILSQILPDSTYLRGATEIALIPQNGTPVTTLLMPNEPLRYGDFDVYMTKLVFEPEIVIRTTDQRLLFDSFVKLDPLVEKRGDFSFYGMFSGSEVVGGAYYQPEKSLMMLVITRGGKRVVADMTFQTDQQVTKGDYIISCAKMGQWSEIHVVRRRHQELLVMGGVIALLGLALRVAIRPQRVWLAAEGDRARVRCTGNEAKRLLQL